MPQKVYFDTVSLSDRERPSEFGSYDLRDYIVVSPLSAFEVLSQLTIVKADKVLQQIQAIHNWINPRKAALYLGRMMLWRLLDSAST